MLGFRVRRGPRPRFWRLLLERIAPTTPAEPPVRGDANSLNSLRSLLDPAVRGRINSFSTFFSSRLRLSFLKHQQIKTINKRPAITQPMMMPALRVRPPSPLLKSSGGGTGVAVPVDVSEVVEAVVVPMVIIVPLDVLMLGELKNEVETVETDGLVLTEVVVAEVVAAEVVVAEVVVKTSGSVRVDEEGPSGLAVTVVATTLLPR